jgi:hypothetical protein
MITLTTMAFVTASSSSLPLDSQRISHGASSTTALSAFSRSNYLFSSCPIAFELLPRTEVRYHHPHTFSIQLQGHSIADPDGTESESSMPSILHRGIAGYLILDVCIFCNSIGYTEHSTRTPTHVRIA